MPELNLRDTLSTNRIVECPFCREQNFDLIGLKQHLNGGIFWEGCQVFRDTLTVEEENSLRNIKE